MLAPHPYIKNNYFLFVGDEKQTDIGLFHMVNSVTCMNIATSLEKAIKRVLNKLYEEAFRKII